MPSWLGRDWIALAAALVVPPAVCAALTPLRTSVSDANLALVLVVVVVAVAAFGNRPAGALSAVSAAVWFDFFLVPPYATWSIASTGDLATMALLLAVGLAVSQLAARARRLRLVTITDAEQLDRIHRTAELVRSGRGGPDVANQVRAQLVDLLGLRACRFEYGRLLGHPARLERDGSIAAGGLRRYLAPEELPDEEIELRVAAGGRFYGRFMLRPTPGRPVPLRARLVAVTLADQAGAAFDAARPTGPGRSP
ncbi:DUF4118 domain-containing protein [Dactylosporangium sp. NPDC051484]|uniref:DUF4118 domain-containing protein n=1 Tax=Dactylosporangium sp. NPDC051484 TaxID=3154942 RepID=UPI00344F0E38